MLETRERVHADPHGKRSDTMLETTERVHADPNGKWSDTMLETRERNHGDPSVAPFVVPVFTALLE